MGKVRLIKGRNMPKEEGRIECGSFEASEKSGMLQKKGRIWKNTHKRSGNQRKRRKVLQKSWGIEKNEREG